MKVTSLLLCATAALTLAQQPRDGQRPPARVGTAVVTGVILSADRPVRPIRRARVTLANPALPFGLAAITDDEGRFAVERVPAGGYTITAAKEGYLKTTHGAVRPGRPGRQIAIADGERREINLLLQRGGVLAGTVSDEQGQPMSGVMVTAHRSGFHEVTGERAITGTTTVAANDRGEYRIFGLAPGDYLVSTSVPPGHAGLYQVISAAEIRQALSDVATQPVGPARVPGMPKPPAPLPRAVLPPPRTVTYAPVFYPGTTSSTSAWRITLGPTEERRGLDIQLEVAATATVSGAVFGPDSRGATVTLTTADLRGDAMTPDRFSRTTRPDGAGNFRFTGVPPGTYELSARSLILYTRGGSDFAGASAAFATTTLHVDGEDITDLGLAPQPGFTISGRLAFDGERPPAADMLAALRGTVPLQPAGGERGHRPPLEIMGDGRFVAHAILPGAYRPSPTLQGIRTPIGGWWLQSILLDDRELLDAPIELTRSSDDVVVTFADRASTFSGTVTDPAGSSVTGHYVIIFSASPAHWFPLSRRIAAMRPDAAGRYSVRNLPDGDYFVVVDDDVEPGQWFDASYLGRMVGRADLVRLGRHEEVIRDIVVPDR